MRKVKKIILGCVLASIVIFSTASFSTEYIEEAQKYFENGEFKAAIIQLKNQLKEHPGDVSARFLLGKSYLKTGDYKQASKEISRAYELNPKDEDIVLIYAKILLMKKNYKKINKIINFKLSDVNKETQRQILNAYSLLGQNKRADAKQLFSDIASQTKNVHAYIGLAKIALLETENKIAKQWVEKALEAEPDNFNALELKATLATINKNYTEAKNIYASLIEKQKNNLTLYIQQALIKFQQQDFDGAKEDLEIVLEQFNFQPQANYLMGQIQLREKKYKDAEESAHKVLNVMPRYHNAMLILGFSHFAQMNYNQADKYLTQYLSANPDNLNAQNVLASVYIAQKNAEQSILIIEGIDKEKINNHASILTTLGTAYLLTGELQKGVDALSRAKALAPESQLIQKKLVDGQFKLGDISNAISGLEKIVDSDKMDPKINYLLVLSYLKQKRYQKAEKRVNESINKTPQDPALYNLKAVIQKLKGNTQNSIDAYNQALSIDHKYIPAYVGLAEIATLEKDFNRAKMLYKKIIQMKPKYLKPYIYLAAIALKQGDESEIEAQLKAGLAQSKGDINAQVSMAFYLSNWYSKQKTPEMMLPIAKELIKNAPENESVLSFQALVQIANKNYMQAEQALKKIINKNETDLKHRFMLASLLGNKNNTGRHDEILVLYDAAIRIEPESIRPVILKSAYLIKNKYYDQALEVADYAQKKFPELALGVQIKADTYRLQKRMDMALVNYQEAYQLQPEQKTLFMISNILSQQGKEDESIKLLEGALKGTGNDLEVLFHLANIYQKNKDYQLSIQYYKKILTIKPDNILAMNNLAWSYAQEQNPMALQLAKKAYDKAPKSASVVDTYAYIELTMGDTVKAIDLFEKASKLAPDDLNIKYHLAEAYYKNNQNDKAKTIIQTLLKSPAHFSEKDKALALLNKL